MEFWKMNGAGNDFIIINNMTKKIDESRFPEIVRTLCERHMSIGADGFMVVEKSDSADFKMLFYNQDGSLGEMCGNGARCICRYGYENGLSGETQTIETTAGIVTGKRIDRQYYRIRLNDPSKIVLDMKADLNGKEYECSYVELGNPGLPHAVVPLKNLRETDRQELFCLGKQLRYYQAFPKGANVNFFEQLSRNHIYEITWERGVEDFTYACGTGTGSMVAVLTLQGKTDGRNVQVDMRGGTLYVDVELEGTEIRNLYLTGPTNIVAKGTVTDENLII